MATHQERNGGRKVADFDILSGMLVLVLTAMLAAQAAPPEETPGSIVATPSEVGKASSREKQKAQLLLLVDHTRALARWMPNETSFVAVLDQVQDRLVAAKEIELAPLIEFEPYLADLTETLDRIETRVSTVQATADLCDPSRRSDRFLLFLDTLAVDGQGQVQARVCEKIAFEADPEGGLAQACIATSLGLLVGQSIHDLLVVCEPSLARASADTGGARLERLSLELAGVQSSVQDSVRSTKLELTQAMSVVAGHVAETSAAYTKQLEDLTVRLEIERALQQGTPYGSIYLPLANGGRLELVRAIVDETIKNVIDSGETANQAITKLVAGDDQLKQGHFKQAFRLYSEAYKAAVALPPKPR